MRSVKAKKPFDDYKTKVKMGFWSLEGKKKHPLNTRNYLIKYDRNNTK